MAFFLKSCLVKIFFFQCTFFVIHGSKPTKNYEGTLPFCDLAESSVRFIFVSTLDGKLTALNPTNDGSIVWSIHPGSESMLSSSIHKLELTNYGHLVRMIPSLNGGLYKFNGENIEVVPVTAESLLQSSFRYSDDLVISGGKETRSFGVSLQSGGIIYECSMKGCNNVSQSADGAEVLVIQRLDQTVRAVEPRTGTEKWNFSVAQHDLKLISQCHSTFSTELNYKLKAVVPEGVIYATDSVNPSKILWKHKFNAPIVSVWQLQQGKLIELNLFNEYQPSYADPIYPPSLYIGMHDKQLYIQESIVMLKKRQEIISDFKHRLIGMEKNYLRIPWKPYSASSPVIKDMIYPKSIDADISDNDISQRQTTALSVLYASPYVNGNGFYLYTEEELEKVKSGSCNVSKEEDFTTDEENQVVSFIESSSDFVPDLTDDLTDVNTPVEIVIVSFWYYWKEVIIISATTAFLCNLMFTRTYLKWKIKGLMKATEEKKLESPIKESDSGVDMSMDISKTLNSDLPQNFTSRYLTDFDPVACLGKGGFGVVFEAKNKIDDCHYAIKRILLPKKIESRERVMREVKALAKLDHHHIVRYFNAWTECPPPGWQENYDKSWVDKNKDMFTSNEVTSTEVTSNYTEQPSKHSVFLNVDSRDPSTNYVQKFNEELDFTKNEISDSFIVFSDNLPSGSDEKKPKCKNETIINFNSQKENLDYNFIAEKLTKSERPSSMNLNLNSSPDSLGFNKVYLYIQMQLCQKQSLRDWLTINLERDYNVVLNIFEQILEAVEHVHLHGLIHRDLKPSNIFFSLDNQIKVGDFGLVTAMTEGDIKMSPLEDSTGSTNESHTALVGTQLYMSQEQLLGKPYNHTVDIYSLGLILFELLVPFTTQMERTKVIQDIKNDKYPEAFKNQYKKEYELLRLMLSHSPDERPTTYEIRAKLSLKQEPVDDTWHLDLPMRRPSSSKTSRTSISSNESSSGTR